MAKLRRTLLIGLGGTGISAILNAKKMFYENYGEIPPMVGFLGLDTDGPGISNAFLEARDGKRISLNNNEKLAISVASPRDIYLRNSEGNLFDWMPDGNVGGLDQLSIGAGQTRSNGRFALTVNEKNVEQYLNRKLQEINDAQILDNADYQLLGADPEVHMVFSLGGGTGSGTFLNMAYLIKRLMPGVKISGYAVLSDVFRSMVPGAMSARVRPNGKGAMIDLDYLAHLDANSEPVEVKWLRQTDKFSERPFNAFYLVDNRNKNNDTFGEVRPLCNMISLAIVTSVGELGVALDSVSDNVSKLIADNAMDIRDKRAWVAGFGCSEIIFDGERLAKLYADKACVQLVNMMLNGGCDDPAIIANNWFDNNRIRENQGKDDVIDYFIENPTPPYQFQEIDNPDNPEQECMHYIDNRAMERKEVLEEKLQALKERIDVSLTDLMKQQANRECGMFLCQNILHAILKQIELCDGEMESEKRDFEDEHPRLETALNTACKELSACMDTWFKKGRKGFEEDVIERTMQLARQRREIERRRMARQFYMWLRVRVGESLKRVDDIIRNLEAVRRDCNDDIQRILRKNGADSFFQFDLATDRSESVSCPLSDIVFNNFVASMRDKGSITSFAGMTSDEVRHAMMEYVRTMPKVKEYEEMGVDDILDRMTQEEVENLLSRAIKKSQPLLPYSYRGFEADLKDRPVETYYVGVAKKSRSRLAQGGLFERLTLGGEKVQFSEVGLKNRIIIYRQLGVIPAFTVSALDNYAVEYEKWENDKPHGSHWDKKLHERMLRERYDLMPKDEASEGKMLGSWVQAIVFGLIKFEKGNYRIQNRGLGGRAMEGWWVNMGESRADAYNFFCDNYDVILPEMSKALVDMDIPGPDNTLKASAEKARRSVNNGTYFAEVSMCPISQAHIQDYPRDYDMLDKEMTYIIDHPDFDR